MGESIPGQVRILDTRLIMDEINELIHFNLDKEWMASQWNQIEKGEDHLNIHPLVCVAFRAHTQIESLIKSGMPGMSSEIWELAELAMKINALKRHNIPGINEKIRRLISRDFYMYRTARYELQIAGMLLQRGHEVEFIEECERKTPDILTRYEGYECEIECKHKEPSEDQIGYIKSIYNNTQTARKQFSKMRPGAIFIEIEKPRFDEDEVERKRLTDEIERAMRNSSSISGVFITSKADIEETDDFVYRHRVAGMLSSNAKYALPRPLLVNLVSM